MQKAIALLVAVSVMAVLVGGCAMVNRAPVTGFIYTDLKAGEGVTSNAVCSKVGKASCRSILGWVALGDASISAATKNGGITKIHHVDMEAKSILGIIADYTVVVYGE